MFKFRLARHFLLLISLLSWGASHTLAQSIKDGFDPQCNGIVRSIIFPKEGDVIIGGDFSQAGGLTRKGIARLYRDGTAKPSFVADITGTGTVNSLLQRPDNKIYVAGTFTNINGVSRRGVALLNTNGTVDSGFVFNVGVSSGSVECLALQPDGKLIIGGNFTSVNSQSRGRVARLNIDGTVDSTFTGNSAYFSPGANGTVRTALPLPGGRMLIGGSFNNVAISSRTFLALLEADGGVNPGFNLNITGSGVTTATRLIDGRILIGGQFTSVGGMPRTNLAVILPEGKVDLSWLAQVEGTGSIIWSTAQAADGKILVGGVFNKIAGTPRNNIARLMIYGGIDSSYDTAANLTVRTFKQDPASLALYAGGDFNTFNGFSRPNLARIYNSGAVDVSITNSCNQVTSISFRDGDATLFLAGQNGLGPINGNGRLATARYSYDGKLLSGDLPSPANITSIDGVWPERDSKLLLFGAFTNLANDSGYKYFTRVNADFNSPAFYSGANGIVSSVYKLSDGRMILGGAGFSLVFSYNRSGLALINSNLTVNLAFPNPITGPTGGKVNAIASDSLGNFYIGGSFTNVGVTFARNIARILPGGNVDSSFTTDITGSFPIINTLIVQKDDRILIGGNFDNVNGSARKHIARLNTNGTLDSTFSPVIGGNFVSGLALLANGQIMVQGSFTNIGGTSRAGLARLNSDGSLDLTWVPSATGGIRNSVAVQSDGKVLVAGNVMNHTDGTRKGLARFSSRDFVEQSLSLNSSGTQITWNRSGPVPEVEQVQIEVSSDGNNYSKLANSVSYANKSWTAPIVAVDVPPRTLRYVRAQAYTIGGMRNGSVGLVESTAAVYYNGAPTLYPGGSASFVEDSGSAASIGISAAITDDGTDLTGLIIQFTNFPTFTEDKLLYTKSPAIAGNYDSTRGILTFSGTTNVAAYATLLQSLKYTNTSDNPITVSRGFSYIAFDTEGAASSPVYSTLNVISANDAPTDLTLTGPNAVPESATGGYVIGTLSSADVDGGLDSFGFTSPNFNGGKFALSGNVLSVMSGATFDFETQTNYAITVVITNSGTPVQLFTKTFNIGVINTNEAPTSLTISNTNILENLTNNTVVSLLAAADPEGGPYTFSLVAGAGSTDNSHFSISGFSLLSAVPFNYETQTSASIRLRVTDGGGLSFERVYPLKIKNVYEPPYDFTLPTTNVLENSSAGTILGDFPNTSPENLSITYTLVSGAGSTDNSQFQIISAKRLRTTQPLDYEAGATRSIRVRATDEYGTNVEHIVYLHVLDVNEAPTNIVSQSTGWKENQPSGTLALKLTGSDPENNPLTWSLVSGTGATNNASFSISNQYVVAQFVANYEAQSSYGIRVRATDTGSNTLETALTFGPQNVNDAPFALALSSTSFVENIAVNTTVAAITSQDADAGDTASYNLVGTVLDNSSFSVLGSNLVINVVPDFEVKPSYQVRLRVLDSGGLSSTQTFTLAVQNQNEPPTLLSFSGISVLETAAVTTVLGTLSATDPDAGDTFTYTLVSGIGSTDNSFVQIVGNQVKLAAPLDYETKATLQFLVEVGDTASNSLRQAFVMNVLNVTEGTVGQPDIRVLGRNLNITKGAATPSTTNGTDFGAAVVGGLSVTRVFKVANESLDTTLTVSSASVSGTGFTVSRLPDAAVLPGTNTELWVNFAPASAAVASGVVTILSNDPNDSPFTFSIAAVGINSTSPTNTVPPPLPTLGALQVTLAPTGAVTAGAKWRPVGAATWLESGATIQNLQATNITLEFRPAAGFTTPTNATLAITAASTSLYTATYIVAPGAPTGSFTVQLLPTALGGAGWKLEGDTGSFHTDGEVVSGLPAGNATLRFADVLGYETPAPRNVLIVSNDLSEITAVYIPTLGATAQPVAIAGLGITNTPYSFNGQITTDAGSGSGFVVTEQAVFTAAHVIFSDFYLSYKTGVRWHFRRQANFFEPAPLEPRGLVVFGGYATSRGRDLATLGTTAVGFSPEARNSDAATLYFPESPGKGGFGGFLSSDAALNEWLTGPDSKQLVGYTLPGPGLDVTNSGTLFHTTPGNYSFTRLNGRALDADGDANRVYVSGSFRGNEGMAGGPLYVDLAGTYFPAAVYLGSDGSRSYVRSIDRNLLLLISVAQGQARSRSALPRGGARLSGGVIVVAPPGTGGDDSSLLSGSIRTTFSPSSAGTFGGRWGVSSRSSWLASGVPMQGLPVDDYTVKFRTADGFTSPASQSGIHITANQTKLVSATYAGSGPSIPLGSSGSTLLKSKANLKWKSVAVADFNNDGSSDLLQQQGSALRLQFFQGSATNGFTSITGIPKGPGWKVVGAADFDRDGRPDILRKKGKLNQVLFLQGSTVYTNLLVSDLLVKKGAAITLGDFNNDGYPDILRQVAKKNSAMLLVGTSNIGNVNLGGALPTVKGWKIVTTGDLGGDAQPDLVTVRKSFIGGWVLSGTNVVTAGYLSGNKANPTYKIIGTGDFDQDHVADIVRLRSDTVNLLQTNQVLVTPPSN